MRIFLLGATGRTGKHVLNQALDRGHDVTALVRGSVDRVGGTHPRLRLISGDLLDHQNLTALVMGHDVLLTALSSSIIEAATSRLIAAAEAAKVSRYIGLAGGGILQLDEKTLRRDRPGYPAAFIKSSEGHLQAWKALERSSLDWTLFCTPDLLDGPASGRAQRLAEYMPLGGKSVPRADVAAFMLDELDHPRFSRKRVGVTV